LFFLLLSLAADKKDEVEFSCKSSALKSKDPSSDAIETTGDQPTTRGITISPDDIKDEIKYKVRTTREGIRVKLEYKNEIEMNDEKTETKSKFELVFTNLVEYVKAEGAVLDTNSSEGQAYDWEADTVIQTTPLTNWDDISGVLNDNSSVVSFFSASSSTGEDTTGNILFNFTVSRADQDEKITANSMKIDVRILDFPWQRKDSYLALLSTLKAETKVKVDYKDHAIITEGGEVTNKPKDVTVSFGADMESTLGFGTQGRYTWEGQADATSMGLTETDETVFNGTVMMSGRQGNNKDEASDNNIVLVEQATTSRIEVVATSPISLGNETFQSIAYSFVGQGAHSASDIYWDPETGIDYVSSAFRSLPGIVGTFVGAVMIAVFA